MKILSIGNSFSQDAQRYLHGIAKNDGVHIKCVNLYIGGCSLRTHYLNMLDNKADYDFEFNGEKTGIKVSIAQALASDDWDYITLQQVSSSSFKIETFSPYIEELANLARKYCPKAKLLIHQTWGYETGSQKINSLGFKTDEEMLSAVKSSYETAATLINADGIIRSGEALLKARELGISHIHHDTMHASLGIGRFILALNWYKTLTGKDISTNSFSDFDVPVSTEERKIAINAV
ncbi:MAG: DUF4886 domain-containing protein, partial [Clostridia bacterium]|nr:DUF4886 domain-containing protein [Clostridia bacterium]